MARYVAFLRALNVGGRRVRMAELKAHFEALGAQGVRTHINSGNVIFDSAARSRPALAQKLEAGLEPRLGFRSEVFLRRDNDVQAIAERARQWAERAGPASTVQVGLLAAAPTPAQAAAVVALATAIDRFDVDGDELIWTLRGNVHDSLVSGTRLERALGGRVSFRKASMLQGLAAALQVAD